MQPEEMKQTAPYPKILKDLVDDLTYRPGYRFGLEHLDRGQGSEGLTFIVVSQGYDSYHEEKGETYRVQHYFPVPPAAFNEASWRRWILERLIELEVHEACEFMQIGEERPFAPNHGPGNDPYVVRELTTEEERRTSFRGKVKPPEEE